MEFKEHLLKHFPSDIIEALLASMQEKEQHACLLNPYKMKDEEFLQLFPHVKKHPLVPHAYHYDKEEYTLGKTIYHEAGAFYLQDPSAMCVASFLPTKKGDYILDMCAAPGGKTIQAAFKEGVHVWSNDLSYTRALTLSSNIERMGLDNVLVTAMNLEKMPACYHQFFDSIILDAPCSGSGMFRKQEEMKKDWTYEKVLSLAKTQKELLALADTFLKEGGYLLYSTCSYSYEEDEEPILEFLHAHENYELIALPSLPYFYSHPDLKGTLHLFPSLFEGEGQFIALLHKKGNAYPSCLKEEKRKTPNTSFLKEFPLSYAYYFEKENKIYGSDVYYRLEKIPVLRLGLEIGEYQKNRFIPSHALSHSSIHFPSIELNNEDIKRYLKGETIAIDSALSGYYAITFMGLSLGWGKAVQGTLKNLYPKGLRKNIV